MSPQQKAFTVRSNGGVLRVLQTQIGICVPFVGSPGDQTDMNCREFTAIWDTGATGSVITERLAQSLGLKPTGIKEVSTANGSCEKNTYLVNIVLPNKVGIQNVNVTEGLLGNSIDVLVGMDIITLGDFSVTNKNGNTVMSFRVPSIDETDYVHVANRANHLEQLKQQRKAKNTSTKKKGKRKKRKK